MMLEDWLSWQEINRFRIKTGGRESECVPYQRTD